MFERLSLNVKLQYERIVRIIVPFSKKQKNVKRNRRNFDFLALQVLSRNIGSFLSLGQGKIRSFLSLGLESSISGNIRKAFFEKTCENFFFEKILKKFQSEIFLGESFESLKTCNFIEKRLQHRCFPVYIVKYLRTAFL